MIANQFDERYYLKYRNAIIQLVETRLIAGRDFNHYHYNSIANTQGWGGLITTHTVSFLMERPGDFASIVRPGTPLPSYEIQAFRDPSYSDEDYKLPDGAELHREINKDELIELVNTSFYEGDNEDFIDNIDLMDEYCIVNVRDFVQESESLDEDGKVIKVVDEYPLMPREPVIKLINDVVIKPLEATLLDFENHKNGTIKPLTRFMTENEESEIK